MVGNREGWMWVREGRKNEKTKQVEWSLALKKKNTERKIMG